MSNALAIAAVTAVLKDLLQNAVIDHDLESGTGEVAVSARSPGRIVTSGNTDPRQINLFLYQVAPNQGWSNVAQPSRDSEGRRISNPPLALDLRYLLTAYGTNDFDAEILLGYAMQVFHETPILARDAIRVALAAPSPVDGTPLPQVLRAVSAADLADQVEQIKIAPLYLDSEEMSRIWSALQNPYRTSTAYQASVVLIESRQPTRPTLPVRSFNLYPFPIERPVIREVRSQAGPNQPVLSGEPILPGQRLVLLGERLVGEATRVRIGATEEDPVEATEERLIVPIPAEVEPGVQGVQVVHGLMMGTPETPHRGLESNVAAFVMHPQIVPGPVPHTGDIQVATTEAVGRHSGTITVRLLNRVGRNQRTLLLLNRQGVQRLGYSFPLPPWDPPALQWRTQLEFPVAGLEPGQYMVRVQVDRAESPLEQGADGSFVGPRIQIP